MRNRYYLPAIGRFISRDPSGLGGGTNMYAYAGDDPANFSDPTGEVGLSGALLGLGFGFVGGFTGAQAQGASLAVAFLEGGTGAVGGALVGSVTLIETPVGAALVAAGASIVAQKIENPAGPLNWERS